MDAGSSDSGKGSGKGEDFPPTAEEFEDEVKTKRKQRDLGARVTTARRMMIAMSWLKV